MIIDILSDLHIDNYFGYGGVSEDDIMHLYGDIFTAHGTRKVGDVLVIAGDMGHNNGQNMVVLMHIKKLFKYKHIVCVLGNHDYYLLRESDKKNYGGKSLNRIEGMRNLINDKEGMYCLNGNIVEIEGIRFGGCDSWYDGKYIKKNFDPVCSVWGVKRDAHYINELWKNSLNDANYIFDFNWQEYAVQEKKKIEAIYKDVDVMITHVNPSIEKEHTSEAFRDGELTGFFNFDGSAYLDKGSMKYWIFGHTHDKVKFLSKGVKCVCNPMGYPSENYYGATTQIKHIEFKGE